MGRILCVAEKPSIARTVAGFLGGNVQGRNVRGDQWLKNFEFTYDFGLPWGQSEVIFTSVRGHVHEHDFDPRYRSWQSCNPQSLFEAPIITSVAKDKKVIAENISTKARYCNALFIWTDCDREGEHIGAEVRDIALRSNPRIEVKRAKFHAYTRQLIVQAARNPIALNEHEADAVAARIELDLRLGAAFTRLQTLQLKPMIQHLVGEKGVISYGSCQFPTLGFVVDRYFRVKRFVPEAFWRIVVFHEKDGVRCKFNWARERLFDRMAVTILYERCLSAKFARVIKMETKPKSKWKPLPLTTVELQTCGARFLRMTSKRVMEVAEKLYTEGWISYPRTETDQFDASMDLRALVQKQTQSQNWGTYAQGLLNGNFKQPRQGRENDNAHPPIHPVNFVAPTRLDGEQNRVYEFVVRRFLACCSEDAKGMSTTCAIVWGGETFSTSGLIVLERNFLDVYPYMRWNSSQELPKFEVGEMFVPTEANMVDGETKAPGYLTEEELIKMMNANGIGTDATIAEHIEKIEQREYVKSRTHDADGADETVVEERGARGGRGRGRGRGRGGRGGANARGGGGGSGNGMREFVPTTLGVALIEGYDNLRFQTSLSKPFLRKEMEDHMRAICEGRMTKADVVHQSLEQYREVFVITTQQMDVLKAAFRKYILGVNAGVEGG
ncbi:DNA topoisomerase 3-beta [Rhizodiscina lignyota]|uniref:DNA topoisomerase n=1 Tax=Rhizodiscina lignyota TaxID=1504668 RepID=A0A9P4IM20_9PEZI|nr:DNA topoisomerase 3-beta [Rhizodiscina lignyota]